MRAITGATRIKRRAVLGAAGVAGAALTACTLPGAEAAPKTLAAPMPAAPPMPVMEAAPAPAPAPAPEVVVAAPPPAPRPSILDLGVDGIVQPFWSAEGDRVLFYDQPGPGLGGTWMADPAGSKVTRERAEWGSYVAGATLLAIPRPDKRDTHVAHLPSGREWALPTINGTLFSGDGTMVAYSAANATPGAPGGGGGFNFSTTTLVVSWADGQNARRLPLPISAGLVAWIPGRDGTPNGRLLLTGRRSRQDGTALYTLDVNSRALEDLPGRTRRLLGPLASPDGAWVASVGMWTGDPAVDGLWVMRTDGSDRRKLDLVGSYRWTMDNRLLVVPMRASNTESHQVWEVSPASGEVRRLTDPAETPFRIANFDWDLTPDGTGLVYVSAETRRLAVLSLPKGLEAAAGPAPAMPGVPAAGNGKPYRLPFTTAPGPWGWYVAQWYGITTTGYRARNSTYREGQGIHFGVDLATPVGTPVVAVAPGRVIAIDGNYGSPPHNVVLELPDGNQAMYGHLIEPSRHVTVGQTVEAGQVVGITGDSASPYDGYGNPHIHLEIRKRGRDVATNPVPYFDMPWDDMSLGVYPGPRFERDLDNPRRYQYPEDQPDIRFGGAIITNFARPWPV